MNKIPKEHIIPEPQKLKDMKVGDICWMKHIQMTQDGAVWVQKESAVFPEVEWDEFNRCKYPFKVERFASGFKVWIPESHLPMKARFSRESLELVCCEVNDIEIINGKLVE